MGRPKSPRRPATPDERQGSLLPAPRTRGRLTAAQLAKANVAKLPGPAGKPELAQLTLHLALRRDALERLIARAIAEERNLEAVVEEILEAAPETRDRKK